MGPRFSVVFFFTKNPNLKYDIFGGWREGGGGQGLGG